MGPREHIFIALIHPIQWTIALPIFMTGTTKRQKKTSCIHCRTALPVPPNARKRHPIYTTGRPYRSRQTPEKDVLYILPVLYRSARPIPLIARKRRTVYTTHPLPLCTTDSTNRPKNTSCMHYWSALPVPPNARKRRPVHTTSPLPLCATDSTNRPKKTSCIYYPSFTALHDRFH